MKALQKTHLMTIQVQSKIRYNWIIMVLCSLTSHCSYVPEAPTAAVSWAQSTAARQDITPQPSSEWAGCVGGCVWTHGKVYTTELAVLQHITTVIVTYITELLFYFLYVLSFQLCVSLAFQLSGRRFIPVPHMTLTPLQLGLGNLRNEYCLLWEPHTSQTHQHESNAKAVEV